MTSYTDKIHHNYHSESTISENRILTLGDVADVRTGPFGSALHESDYKQVGTPIVTVEHLGERGLTRQNLPLVGNSDVRRLAAYKCRAGDILFSRVGSIDRSARVSTAEDGWLFSGRLLRVRVTDPQTSPLYLSYLMSTEDFKNQVRSVAVGQTMPSLNTQILKNIPLELPPLPRQVSISHTLADADALVDGLERQIAKKEAIHQGLMQQLLTGKIRLPGFTAPWRNILLGDHVTYVKTVALSRAQLNSSSHLRYLHYGDIHTRSSTRLNAAIEEMPRVSRSLAASAGRLQVGDLVFADASEDPEGVGKSVEIASVPPEGVIPGLHTIAARFDKAVLADGFKAYLQFIPTFRNTLLRLAAGTKVLATTRSYISSVTLPLPGLDEQLAIAQVLIDSDAELVSLRKRLAKAQAVKQGMMQELLTGRTRLPVMETAS